MLEALTLSISRSAALDPLIMPLLQTLAVNINLAVFDNNNHTQILRSFICPSLAKFSLITCGRWSRKILEILKKQYNMEELRGFEFKGPFALHVSPFLRSAPMLHSFSLRLAVLDDEAIIGISNGSLGRFLRRLEIQTNGDVGDLFGVVVVTRTKDRTGYEERIIALKEAGIAIKILIS